MTTTEFYSQLETVETKLQRFAYKLTQNIDASRDLFQDTAYRALKNREKFAPGTNFKAWSFTIMKNLFINDYRKKSRARVVFDNSQDSFILNSGKQSIRNEGESTVMMQELTEIINNLDEGLRYPFMRYFEGYKYQEIAEEMNLPLGTVKSRIFFARKILKEQLKNSYNIKYTERA